MKPILALSCYTVALYLILFCLVEFGAGFILCIEGQNPGHLAMGMSYGFASMIVAAPVARMGELFDGI